MLRKIATGIALLFALLGAAGYLVLASTLPKTSGELTLAGLNSPVEIVRGPQGVPRISAETMDDAAFALGFVHAQDRFFQMELMRRLGAGRLSELIGDRGLETDRFMRTLGLYRLAEGQVTAASPALRARLRAYAAGVNAWLTQKPWPKTPEFIAFIGFSPEPWRPADSLVWGKLMATRLANNWRTEHLRLGLSARLTPEQIDFLWPAYPAEAPTLHPRPAAALPAPPGGGLGDVAHGAPSTASNAWVIAGRDGAPLMVNDPHLGFRAPVLWYLARIETPDERLAGATVPGVPFMVIGHNGHVAWGFTTTGADTEDLIVETLTDGGKAYKTPSGPRPFETRAETLGTATDPVPLKVRKTAEGPIIANAGPDRVLTLAASYLRPGDTTPEALLRLNAARDQKQLDQALVLFTAPVQNLFFATRGGAGGFRTVGKIPIRHRGNGRFPLVRTDGPVGPAGHIPYAEMPRADLTPQTPVVLNANNRVTANDYPHLITTDWEPPFRARRLAGLLADPDTDPVAPLYDNRSLAALDLIAAVRPMMAGQAAWPAGRRLLMEWDGEMTKGQRAPLVFYEWALALKRRIFADEMGPAFARWHGLRVRAVVRALDQRHFPDRAGAGYPVWCDDGTTPAKLETCAEQVAGALQDAQRKLATRDEDLGRPAVWADVHVARFEHPIFSHVPVIRRFTTPSVATDGGHHTLNRGGMHLGRPNDPFVHRHGAGLRAIFDMANPRQAQFIIATGQSGNPLSAHYDDLLAAWAAGRTLTLADRPKAGHALKLLPSPP